MRALTVSAGAGMSVDASPPGLQIERPMKKSTSAAEALPPDQAAPLRQAAPPRAMKALEAPVRDALFAIQCPDAQLWHKQ
jgi:hypothetical protein